MSELVTGAKPKYDAFISYSHGSDLLLAQALQHDLERFARPWYRPRVTRVFRDFTNLSASPGMWSTIEEALRSSSWFVLMASPASARSEWVAREVRWWTSNRGTSHLLIALTDGIISWRENDFDWDATDALPLELAAKFGEEPIWVDLRMLRPSGTAAAGTAVPPPDLGDVVAEFAAPIMGRDKDELIGKHLAERRLTRRLVAAVIAAMALLVVLAGAGALIARDQRDEAIRQRAAADAQARVAISRALAAASRDHLQASRDLSLLLAVESFRSSPTLQARDSLLSALTGQPYVVQYLRGASATVTSVSVVGDGDTVFSGHENGDVMRWDLTKPRPTPRRVVTVRGRVHDLAVDVAGSQLAVAADHLVLADIDQEKPEVQSLPGPALGEALAFSPDGEMLVNTGCRSTANSCLRGQGQVKVWDLGTREFAASGRAWGGSPVTSAVVSQDSELVALGSYFGDVAILDLSTLEVDYLASAGRHPDVVESLAFSPDGRRLVSASGTAMPMPDDPSLRAEPTIRTWDVSSGSPTGTATLPWQSEGANPFDIALSPDGKVVATAGDHTIIKLWDARTGQLQAELPGHHSLVGDLSFSTSGSQLVSG